MAIVSEVNAVCDLAVKAASFITQLHDNWYKGSAELKTFKIKVSILTAKQAQWTSQLQRYGMAEDEHLTSFVQEAVQILEKQQQYLQRMKKRPLAGLRKKVFPGQLTHILNSVLEIVDAGPQLLATRVETNDLLERNAAQTATSLPFGPDRKYVPLSDPITEVQKALEDAGGPRVVTVHAGPGMGKTSLVKYIALHYQQQRKQGIGSCSSRTVDPYFPNGVFYLFCGKGADTRVNQLVEELLESLGLGANESRVAEDLAGESKQKSLRPLQTKLRCRLGGQKALVVIDDLWETEVLENLIVAGEGVKYLVASQTRGIWFDAKKIKLQNPKMEEAEKIMANHTEGLPKDCEFPDNIKSVTCAIIEKLEYHPLSLANIGISIDMSRATDPNEWGEIKENLCTHLDEDNFHMHNGPLAYERRYPLSVGASMMLMVDSLHPDARNLLFLLVLLEGPEFPELLVKILFKFMEPTQSKYKYNSYINYLKDRSLVVSRLHGNVIESYFGSLKVSFVEPNPFGSEHFLGTHSLRSHFIRKKYTADVTSIATKILGGNRDHGVQLTYDGDADDSLVTILGAMYYEQTFRDVVEAKLQKRVRFIDHNGLPRTSSGGVVVEWIRGHLKQIEALFGLLNPDGEGGWKQEAHGHAREIIVRCIRRGELDDKSMARLLQSASTYAVAYAVLRLLSKRDNFAVNFYDHNRTFLTANGETMKALLTLSHNSAAPTHQRGAAIRILGKVLAYQSEDSIVTVAENWMKFLAEDSNMTLQCAVTSYMGGKEFDSDPSRASVIVASIPGVLEQLLRIVARVGGEGLFYGPKDDNVQYCAARALMKLSRTRSTAVRIAAIPGALETLLQKFLSEASLCALHVGFALIDLFSFPENRMSFREVKDGLERLGEALSEELQAMTAAKILGNLAFKKDLRETIVKLPGTVERLQILRVKESFMPTGLCHLSHDAARALTILDAQHDNPMLTAVRSPPPWACVGAYMGSAEAYCQMGMHSEALVHLKLADHYLHQLPDEVKNNGSMHIDRKITDLRKTRIFLRAMLEDYSGAMSDADCNLEECSREGYGFLARAALGERGVLKRLSGDLSGALDDLDAALERSIWLSHFMDKYDFLKHRGIVRFLMGDKGGARADAKSALELRERKLAWETSDDALGPRSLLKLPVNYFNFTL